MIAPAIGAGAPVQVVLPLVAPAPQVERRAAATGTAGDVRRLPVQRTLFAERPDPWIERFSVASRSERRVRHVVARHRDGGFGCTCRGWIFQALPRGARRSCHHIALVKERLGHGL